MHMYMYTNPVAIMDGCNFKIARNVLKGNISLAEGRQVHPPLALRKYLSKE